MEGNWGEVEHGIRGYLSSYAGETRGRVGGRKGGGRVGRMEGEGREGERGNVKGIAGWWQWSTNVLSPVSEGLCPSLRLQGRNHRYHWQQLQGSEFAHQTGQKNY